MIISFLSDRGPGGEYVGVVHGDLEGVSAVTVAARSSAGDAQVVIGRTFGDVPAGGALLYADSDGGLALAVNGGSATALLGVRTRDEVRLAP
jgi:S-adenosylmethionine hydrolase